MEPMALGSPTGSPAAGSSPFLPSFLMGDTNLPTTPRSNTLSPTKGRNVSFNVTSPGINSVVSPPDFNRSTLGQKGLYGYQQTPPNFPGTPVQSHNTSISGPPKQGLFDSLRSEVNNIQTPTKSYGTNPFPSFNGTPNINQSYNDSILNQSNFNASRITSPGEFRLNQNSQNLSAAIPPRQSNFWITVYGFPPQATSMILSHFSQCGTIIDKIFPTESGNWIHLKFSSRLECDKALNYNEKILANNIMIGVTHCKDSNIVDKENLGDNNQVCRVRPLTHIAYKSAQNDTAVCPSPTAPQRSSGIVNKAMDLLFGW